MSQVWLVTGSSRGLGLLSSMQHAKMVLRSLRRLGSPMTLDVTNNCDVAKAGHEKFGRNDVVVNTARYANLAATEDIAIDDFRAQVDASFLGVVYITKAVLPILRQQGLGHVL
ncbi:hypothetical protein BGZ61DRAFT_531602 [Ilyonectria robusta]|uniref:uncharacterized protein n=1 Tax=Ilyonectria robusta TaxID=1079257 RepID=UPI001E8EEE6A|nr:uncharacterized protein BGZ61DRAFT_531602 [Ilyonectria robusta]KAH8706411.1 hypothetical protein BGZ61DRAFT_531602 [Ilyonectria robusta]